MIPVLLGAGALALAIVLSLGISTWRHQERILFQPPAGPWITAETARLEYRASDGQALFAWLVEPEASSGTAPRRLLISFHGNAEIAAWGVPWAREVARRTGATVLLPEYRGYAGLDGTPTYASSATDAMAAWEAAQRELGATAEHTSLYGHSLGTAIATELAHLIEPRSLILEAPFTSAREMASRLAVPGVRAMFGLLSRIHFDTRARVAGISAPVAVVHGTRDVIIPVRMGREVHAAAREQGELLLVEGAGHNDIVERGDHRYWEWLERALGG